MATKVDLIQKEEVTTGAIHIVDKETITIYKNIISDPLLQDDLMEIMCNKLERLAQQGFGTEDTDRYIQVTITRLVTDLDKFKIIVKDKVVT